MSDNLLFPILDERAASGLGGRWYGVYPALVTNIKDPDGQGRVKIMLPWSPDLDTANSSERYDVWARMAMTMAGSNRGSWFIPEENDEVLVAFEGGDARRPYILGMLWNGKDKPHETMPDDKKNNIKSIRSRNGVKITLDDDQGKEKFIVETPGGQKITLKDGPGVIEIMDSNGNSAKFESNGITFNTSSTFTINASTLSITAGSVSVSAGTSTFSGLVVANGAVQTPSVIGQSYTPGAGNIW